MAAAALAGGWLAACAPAAPIPELPAPRAAAPLAPAPSAVVAETPDDTLRYKPPLVLAARGHPPPGVEEMTFANGMRALLIERHDLPLVVARVVVRRRERPSVPNLQHLIGPMLLETKSAGGQSLLTELWSLGVSRDSFIDDDSIQLELKAAAPVFAGALRRYLTTLAAPTISREALDEVRKNATTALRNREKRGQLSLRVRLARSIDEQLLPRDHRYSDFRDSTAADMDALKVADMQRYRDRELHPARVTVCVIGDATPAALREAIESATAAWRPASPSPANAAPGLARGVFLVEQPGEARADIAVVVPAPPMTTAQGLIGAMAVAQLSDAMEDWLKREVKTPWSEHSAESLVRGDTSLIRVAVEVDPEAIAPVVRGVLEVMERLGKGEISAEELASYRNFNLRWQEGLFKSNSEAVKSLALIPALGIAPDFLSRRYQATLTASQGDVVKLARDWFTRGEARVIAIGNVAAAKPELQKLGLGPVTLVPAGTGAGARTAPRKTQ